MAVFAFLRKKMVMQPLKKKTPARQHHDPAKNQQQQQPCPPHRQAHRERRIQGGSHGLDGAGGGGTRCTRAAGGTRMRRVLAAIFSTRECIAQVLCSSCNCPYSTSSWLATSCCFCNSTKTFRPLCCA